MKPWRRVDANLRLSTGSRIDTLLDDARDMLVPPCRTMSRTPLPPIQ
jgi:hypothetical protein